MRSTVQRARADTKTKIESLHTNSARESVIKQKSKSIAVNMEQLKKQENDMDKIFKRIDLILKKIMLLTMFVEIGYVISAITTMISTLIRDEHAWILIIEQILGQMQLVNIGWSLYLMMEHNSKSYFRVLWLLDSCNICCCFSGLIEQMKEQQIAVDIVGSDGGNINGDREEKSQLQVVYDSDIGRNNVERTVDTKTRDEHQVMQGPTMEYNDDESVTMSVRL